MLSEPVIWENNKIIFGEFFISQFNKNIHKHVFCALWWYKDNICSLFRKEKRWLFQCPVVIREWEVQNIKGASNKDTLPTKAEGEGWVMFTQANQGEKAIPFWKFSTIQSSIKKITFIIPPPRNNHC